MVEWQVPHDPVQPGSETTNPSGKRLTPESAATVARGITG